MIQTLYQIYLALFMVAVAIGLLVWFLTSQKAASARRMKSMMMRVGLDPEIATHGSPQFKAIMREAGRRCRKCRTEDFCERWLRGIATGENTFCPNARLFNVAASTLGNAPMVSATLNQEAGPAA